MTCLTRFRPLLPLAIAALLAACGDEPAADDGRAAQGEVLEGTISDAMLPLDTVRSQPPLAQPEAAARVRARAATEYAAASGSAAVASAEAAVASAAEVATSPAPSSAPQAASARARREGASRFATRIR